ncbi:MAG TPA: universal stress protein [Gemmatimonadaceae bacterium]|nr:universal stress protein [Gemmatimonadaceae bacterium]
MLACVDTSHFAEFVADYAAWAAQGMHLPLEFLHILDRHPEQGGSVTDRSGSLGVEPQEALMERLVADEAARSKAARERGRVLLSGLRDRAMARGVNSPSIRQRYGELEETLVEQEERVELFVLGRRGENAENTGRDLGRNLERVVRALKRPILAVTEAFVKPQRTLIAFDGGIVTRRGVEMIATSTLFRTLHCDIVMSGEASRRGTEQLEKARDRLLHAGLSVEAVMLPGDPEREIAQAVRARGTDLLVMGAYGHSVLRRLFMGSRTSDLLRASTVPTLLLR